MSDVVHCSQTHVGLARENNEDSLGWLPPSESGRGWVFVVADGMGGAVAGAAASQTAVKVAKETYVVLAAQKSTGVFDVMSASIEAANLAILDLGKKDHSMRGMGTTIVMLVLYEGLAYVAHVGDSRIYRYRGGRLEQLTHDHTRVQMLADQGIITPAQARSHPESHVISRNLGGYADVAVEVPDDGPFPLRSGDLFLSCSDGLHGLVGDEAISRVISEASPDHATPALISLANRRGGYDNITVSIVLFGDGPWTESLYGDELSALVDELAYEAVSDTALFDAYDPDALTPADFETKRLRALETTSGGPTGPNSLSVTMVDGDPAEMLMEVDKAARAGLKHTVAMTPVTDEMLAQRAQRAERPAPRPKKRRGVPILLLTAIFLVGLAIVAGIGLVAVLLSGT